MKWMRIGMDDLIAWAWTIAAGVIVTAWIWLDLTVDSLLLYILPGALIVGLVVFIFNMGKIFNDD